MLKIQQNISLAQHNTFHLPVKTRWFMEYENEEDLGKILRDEYFQECLSIHIGQGSNLLFLNDYNGIVLHSRIGGIEITSEDEESVILRVGAGCVWDEVVAYAVSQGWYGIENLSAIPGEMGAAAVQNIGAYGVELKDVVESVEAYNQLTFEKQIYPAEACGYGYRESRFKNPHEDPHIITQVNLRLSKRPHFTLEYGQLRERVGEKPTLEGVREAVIAIRREKLPDPAVLGNAGSYFKNPVVGAEQFRQLQTQYPAMPSYPAEEGKVKIPAGWLIEQCGYKGKREGEVGVYEKQALVLVNYGGATGDEIALLAESIRTAVQERFGIELMPEVKYVV